MSRKILESQRSPADVVCKCERVTEQEVIDACHRSLPIDSTGDSEEDQGWNGALPETPITMTAARVAAVSLARRVYATK